ncbi:TonB-dependent receptor [Sphingomicrobium astaxanthinifaciens]|uniref:TonB-dependent receptor n=1 Tax=Sphingomicrobium astaxanthinifaciens TaxID=1227949 RepID=UPI001FCBCABF|nr:TonB-dependent receptor [Sphingomicrobium astaxanthinifaciens]MCJ7421438.1 TonB-dependent receptor [Sphingomicrobium astaxanthinifaciens]
MRMLGTASSFAMVMALSQPAYAQDASDPAQAEDEQEELEGTDMPVVEEDDTVVITGYLRSLETAAAIKRDADTFVDVITAEDIGALPDRSVAESLQRVPGVNISRFVQRDDPDRFSVEGSGVIIRGLPYVRSELNGRDIFSANGGRTLGFNDVSPELLGRVEVFKNLTADMVEGGISGTVNLVTRKPLDNPGLKIAGTIEANVGDLAKEWSPGFSGLVSNTWDFEAGTIGLQAAYAQQELVTRTDASQITDPCFRPETLLADQPCFRSLPTGSGGIDGNADPLGPDEFDTTGLIIAPKGAGVRTTTLTRDRNAFSGVAQFESAGGELLITAEYLRAETDGSLAEFAVLAQVNDDNFSPVIAPGTNPVIIGRELVSATLTQTSQEGITGIPTETLRFVQQDGAMTEDFSVDVDFALTDRLRGNVEFQTINSDRSLDGVITAMRSFSDIFYDNSGETPVVRFFEAGSGGNADLSAVADPEGIYYWFHLDGRLRNEGDLNSLRGDMEYDLEAGPLKRVRFGARWAERNQKTRQATYQVWSNLGDTWTTRNGDWSWSQNDPSRFYGAGGGAYVVDFPGQASLYDPFGDNFQRGNVAAPVGAAFYYGGDDLLRKYLAGTLEADFQAIQDFTRSPEQRDLIPLDEDGEPIFQPASVTSVGEGTLGLYARADYEHEFDNGWVLDGNFGVRYVETNVRSDGILSFPEPGVIDNPELGGDGDGVAERSDLEAVCAFIAGNPGLNRSFCSLPDSRRDEYVAALNGARTDLGSGQSYDNWLPSFNARLDFGNGMLVRGAVSKAIFRPDLAANGVGGVIGDNIGVLVQSGTLDSGPLFAINTGNPFLNATQAWNYDLSFEWYWDTVGSLTVTGFMKDIDDVVTSGAVVNQLVNSETGLAYDVRVDGPQNLESGRLKGVEVAYQQVYDFLPGALGGIGSQLTYTYVDGGEFFNDAGGARQSPFAQGLPLAGISEHTVNAVLFYEYAGLSARAAYNWRSDFLQTPRDVIFPFSPIYGEDTGQLDASIFYAVTDNVKVGVQGVNLLDEVTRTSQLIDYDGTRITRSAFRNDRRFTFLARFDF